ncbi:MAG TPA: hypothetical protein VG452_01505 [Egibacteraceae bacterium]|nr:hypothetical protein [Actinomycetota bacterium]HWB70865.1 hypothetical protein [Egibacteraceae bacterium]
MQPLTHQVWAKHFVALRPYVLEEWPEVDQAELEAVRDDWDGLLALIQDATGLSADLIRQRLRKLDVEELGLGTGQRAQEPDEGRASLAQLRLGDGFADSERDRIVARLQKLNRRLRRFPADGTELLLTVKDRETPAQKLTLECGVPKFARFVATSNEADLKAALMEVREELWRQIDEAVAKRKEMTH